MTFLDCPKKISSFPGKDEPQINISTEAHEENNRAMSGDRNANVSERPNLHMRTQLDREEAYRRGLMKESWCHVEGKKEQVWLRSTRRHFPKVHNMSTLFNEVKNVDEGRCEWKVQEAVNRKERRHFRNKGMSFVH